MKAALDVFFKDYIDSLELRAVRGNSPQES